MGRWTLGEVRDGSGESRWCPERFGEPSERFGMGQGTLGEVRDGLWNPRGGPGQVRGP